MRLAPVVVIASLATAAWGATPAVAATWHVRAGAGAGGKGSERSPFGSLDAVQAAAGPGDTIVVDPAPRSAAPLDGGIALEAGQRLVGGGPPVAGAAGLAALPVLTNTRTDRLDGDGVRLAPGATISNLVVRGTARGGIYGLDSVGARIAGNDVSAHNTSCTPGFKVQPFTVPTGIPFVGGGVGGMGFIAPQNGWAGIMVDGDTGRGPITVEGNVVHNAGCGDGIDIRAAGTSELSARVDRNSVSRLKQGPIQGATVGSVLAIGMQARDSARLEVTQDRNEQRYIGSNGADCEGQFANTSEAGEIVETVDHNTFAHGIGGTSCNGFETIISNGGGLIDVHLRNSTFEDDPGDMMEEGNLGIGSTMRFVMENTIARHTTIRGGTAPFAVDRGSAGIPFNVGECIVLGNSGSGNTTTFRMRDSVFEDCNNGISALSSNEASNGTGPAQGLVIDLLHDRIATSAHYDALIANAGMLRRLQVRVESTEITRAKSYGLGLEQFQGADTSDARLDLGGGVLGSAGGNCLLGSAKGDVETSGFAVSARSNWWGQPGGPRPGQVVSGSGGKVDTTGALATRPDCGPRPAASLRAQRCLARRAPIGPRGVGRVRLGSTRRRLLRLPVRTRARTRRTLTWCVKRSRGRVTAVLSPRGRARLVVTTARSHGNRGVRPGRTTRTLRAYRRRTQIASGLFRASPHSPRLIGVRGRRVRYLAVADRRLLSDRRSLRRYLRLARRSARRRHR